MTLSVKRASYLRRVLRGDLPGTVSAEDRAALDAYEAAKRPPGRPKASAPRAGSHRATAPARSRPPAEPSGPPGDGAPPPAPKPADLGEKGEPWEGFPRLDFGEPTGDGLAAHTPEPAACPIKNCPKCKDVRGSMVCAVTGERVWPPMSVDGAKGLAGGILGICAVVARFFGKDIQPTEDEISSLGKALSTFAYRRASYIGAGDEYFALAFVFGAFLTRAYYAPALPAKGTS